MPGDYRSCTYKLPYECPDFCVGKPDAESLMFAAGGCDPEYECCEEDNFWETCWGGQYCKLDGSGWNACSACP
jgi:hypothetical protein